MVSNAGSGLIVGYEFFLHSKLQTAPANYPIATLAGQGPLFPPGGELKP